MFFDRFIPIRGLAVKVDAWATYHRSGQESFALRFHPEFQFPLLPNAVVVDLEVNEAMYHNNQPYRHHNKSSIDTWEMVTVFLRHHIETRKPFWITISDIKVLSIRPHTRSMPRVLAPPLWYTITVGSFTLREFKHDKFVRSLVCQR